LHVRAKVWDAPYCWCSSDDQKHQDFSTLDVQNTLNREYMQDKGGIMAGLYKDEAVSGTTLKRKGFQQLLADTRAGKFDAVIVTYRSRLGQGDIFAVAEYLLKAVMSTRR
jgi:site-specific DNA recombinase